ncbi:LytTr DNA-binding domain family [Verrucomicrobiia bacterium DG1235]|nr:LytTr DNA-binding domain family [Verrucomicrobiae bacterium DG1235]
MNILIVEDEASIRDRLLRLTRSILENRIQSLETANSLPEAESLLAANSFDVLLLDLNLNGEDGFELLKSLATRSFHTIVVSAYSQRAIEAFELGVIDFVAKPFDQERLAKSFNRILGSDTTRSHFAKFLAVRSHTRIELIPLDEIEYIQADGPCSLIVKTDGSQRPHDKMLKDLSQLLPPSFERVHKSFIANMKAISGLQNGANHKNNLSFHSGKQIPVSRSKAKELKTKIQ